MLIENDGRATSWIIKPLRFLLFGRRAPAACLFAVCALLCASRLNAQDLLLKEYIYLDGRLLAVERQIVGPFAQMAADDAVERAGMAPAQELHIGNPKIQGPGNSGASAMSGNHSAPAPGAYFGFAPSGLLRPEGVAGPCPGCEHPAQQYKPFLLYRDAPKLRTNPGGGKDEDK